MRPPILLVHGAFGQAANFEPWRGYFRAAGYPTTAISLPGHAPVDEEVLKRLTLADCLAAVGEAAAKLDRAPIVIGHSMGGLLAMMLAAEAECAALVTVAAPAPGRLPAQFGGFRYAIPHVGRILAGLPVKPSPAAIRSLVTHDLSPAESDEVIAQTGMESGLVLRKLAFCDTEVALSTIRCPVLCLSGDGDRVVPRSAGYRIAAETVAEHIVFPDHGHWLIAGSLVGTVAAPVREWLERHV
jgi:pimeloyl-ACP methyl ester carboxylesterase